MTIFYIPTKIIIGRNCIRENADLLPALGTRALIVTGKRSAKTNGAEHDVRQALEERSIPKQTGRSMTSDKRWRSGPSPR